MMKHLLKFVLIILFGSIWLYVSCSKELSCENCNINQPPVANAGSRQLIVLPLDSVTIDGSASKDPDGKITGYQWKNITGLAAIILQPVSAKTEVKDLKVGSYQFELTVTDNGGLTAKDTVQIIVDPVVTMNHAPLANAGADILVTLPNNTVILNGTGSSDPENNITNYDWSQITGPGSSNIAKANTAKPEITNLVAGVYQLELKVTDAGGLSSKDTMQVIVKPSSANNILPVANAGNDTAVQLNQTSCSSIPIVITLNGSRSYDPDGIIVSYLWSGPGVIADPSSAITTVTGLFPGNTKFILKVTDNSGGSTSDTIEVNGRPGTRPFVQAQLNPIGNLSITRESVAVATAGNKILFAGGNKNIGGALTPNSRVDIYNITTNTWTTAELSEPRSFITAAVLGNKIFFAGGDNGNINASSAVDIYDASNNTWTTTSLAVGRWQMAAGASGNKVLFAGGMTSVTTGYYTKADIYDITSNTWSVATLSGRLPGASVGIAATTIGSKIFLAGSSGNFPGFNLGDLSSTINIYDVAANSWTTQTLNEARGFLAGISVDNKNYWAGGDAYPNNQPPNIYSNLVEIRDINSSSSSLACLFQPNAFFSAVKKNDDIVFFTGKGPVKNKFDIYNERSNIWSIGVLNNTIESAAVIAVNNIIYVAGGYVDGVLSNKCWILQF